MPDESVRISFALPIVPQSLRAFVEKAATNQRFLAAFFESPLAALHGAGVPIRPEGLTQQDFDRWFTVLGNLQKLVASGKIAKDFQFEQVFKIGRSATYESANASTHSASNVTFDHSTAGTSAFSKAGTRQGISAGFPVAGLSTHPGQLGDQIIAPLLSPAHLATIATLMQAQLNMEFGALERE
jgi:hypothetical protein